jgi:hypothetical protein
MDMYLMRKPFGKWPLGRKIRNGRIHTKMAIRKMVYGDVKWTELAQNCIIVACA